VKIRLAGGGGETSNGLDPFRLGCAGSMRVSLVLPAHPGWGGGRQGRDEHRLLFVFNNRLSQFQFNSNFGSPNPSAQIKSSS